MPGVSFALLLGVSASSVAVSAYCASRWFLDWRMRRRLRAVAMALTSDASIAEEFAVTGMYGRVLALMARNSRAAEDLSLSGGMVARLGEPWYADHCVEAGLAGMVTAGAFCRTQVQLSLAGLAVGALVGLALSNILMAMGAVVGALVGFALPRCAVDAQVKERAKSLEKELPELLEVMSLGLRSGLSFDRSFGLYSQHFDTAFARACAGAQRQWTLGLKTRERALRDLAQSYASPQFKRVVETTVRALRFGSTLSAELEQAAAEARATRKAHRQEQVAKAPVKMMIPTGTLILPAMLLLVLGPVLLEMVNGF